MILRSLFGKNFRNLAQFRIDFSDKGNIVFGENGSGKTNLLEAIYLLSIFKSFRTSKNNNAIRFNTGGFELKGDFGDDGTFMKVEFLYYLEKKQILLNNEKIYLLSKIVGEFPTVLISPEQYIITSGAPEARRRFLDVLLSQIDNNYLQTLIAYRKILKQRNKLLKEKEEKEAKKILVSSWDEEISQYSSLILCKRVEYIEKLKVLFSGLYKEISNNSDSVTITYRSSVQSEFDKSSVLKYMSKNVDRDIELKTTSIGPHRDDLIIELKNKNIRYYGSQGEHKTALLALKIAEYYILKEIKNTSPVILMDDVNSMLDKLRLNSFLNLFAGFGQYFITSVDKTVVLPGFEGDVFELKKGEITKN